MVDPLNLVIVVQVMARCGTLNTGIVDVFQNLRAVDGPLRIEHVQQWLSRLRQLPISIQIHPHPSAPYSLSDPLVGEFIDVVNSYSHCWENLEIGVAPWLKRCCNALSKPSSILEALILPCTRGYIPPYEWLIRIYWNNVTHFAVGLWHSLGNSSTISQALGVPSHCLTWTVRRPVCLSIIHAQQRNVHKHV
jgi:hypothetical protein